ncbi:MAG: zinc-ribbon domain-containing protein, partial [Candidatus Bathyarchaeia archaeon]
MSYCWKCGASLKEESKFCHVCGVSVAKVVRE